MRFEKPKWQRLHKQFFGVKVDGFWWLPDYKQWCQESMSEIDGPFEAWFKQYLAESTKHSHAPCRTIRAFKRMLRKHPWIKGRATLVSKFEGYDVYA